MSIKVVTFIDQDLLSRLEKLPAIKVLAMTESSREQVNSAIAFVRSGDEIPEILLAIVFQVDQMKIVSSIEDFGDLDPRTGLHNSRCRYLVHRFDLETLTGGGDG